MSSADNPTAPATVEDDNKAISSSETPTTEVAEPVVATPATKPDVTADVTRMLMDGKIDGVDPSKTADVVETDPAEEQPAPKAKPSSAVAAPIDLPKVRHPFDDAEDPTLEDIDGRAAEKTRAGFARLQGRLRQAREEGQFGAMIIDVARSHDLDPNAVAAVVGLTAKARKGDTKALAELHGVLAKMGIAPPPAAMPTLDKEALLDVESSKVYKELFAADVAAADMTEEKAREKAKVIAGQRLESRALSQSHTQSTPPDQTNPAAGQGRLTSMQQAASNAVETLASKYAEAYKKSGADFAPVQKAAQDLIAEKVKKDGPIPPLMWEYEFSQAVAQVQRKRQAAQQKPQTTTGSLRPSGASGASGGKSGQDFRARIVENIVSGNIDKI